MSKGTKSKKVVEEAVAPQATPTPATSKAMMMANIVDGMAKMSAPDLLPFFEKWQAMIGHEADTIPNGAAAKNLASIKSGGAVVSEEIKSILESESLSDETKEKAAVLFEAAVGTRVALIQAQLEEENEKKLDEHIDQMNETLMSQVDQYLTYVAEQWIKENKADVRRSLKTELAESFIRGLHNLYQEHGVSIPDDQIDAVEALTEEIEKLKSKLDEQVNENIQNKNLLEKYQRDDVIKQETEGLALTQVEKVKKLAEGVEGSDMETFRRKVKLLRESQFPTSKPAPKVDEPVVAAQETVEKKTTGSPYSDMKSLAAFMKASVNK